jgi:hypothetical protein
VTLATLVRERAEAARILTVKEWEQEAAQKPLGTCWYRGCPTPAVSRGTPYFTNLEGYVGYLCEPCGVAWREVVT